MMKLKGLSHRGPLVRGIHCKACDKPINGDPELCPKCLDVARKLINYYDPPDEEEL